MKLRNVWKIFKKDLLDLIRTRARLIALFLFPLLMIFFLGAGFGGEVSGIETIVTAENEESESAQQLIQALEMTGENAGMFDIVEKHHLTEEEARREMERDYHAMIYIPSDYDLNDPESDKVRVLSNPEQGQQVEAAIMDAVGSIMSNLRGGSLPREAARPYGDLNYIDFLAPAIIVMMIFFGAGQGTGRALAGEKEEGTLDRLAMTPASAKDIIAGKTLYATGVQLVRSLIIILAVIFLFGVTMNGSWLLVGLIVVLMAIASVGLGLFLSAISEDEASYSEISMLVVPPAIFVTGIFFPVSAMPSFLQFIAYIYPLTYANTAIRRVMLLGAGIGDVGVNLLILAIFAVVLYFVGVFLFDYTARR